MYSPYFTTSVNQTPNVTFSQYSKKKKIILYLKGCDSVVHSLSLIYVDLDLIVAMDRSALLILVDVGVH